MQKTEFTINQSTTNYIQSLTSANINNNDIWEGDLKDEGHSEQQRYRIVRVARDGPKWEPNIYVDVVVLVKSDGNKCALIKANNQIIHRTD